MNEFLRNIFFTLYFAPLYFSRWTGLSLLWWLSHLLVFHFCSGSWVKGSMNQLLQGKERSTKNARWSKILCRRQTCSKTSTHKNCPLLFCQWTLSKDTSTEHHKISPSCLSYSCIISRGKIAIKVFLKKLPNFLNLFLLMDYSEIWRLESLISGTEILYFCKNDRGSSLC